MITEREYINLIRQFTQIKDKDYLIKGIGDDCAVLDKDGQDCLLLTTDTLVEGVHFDRAWHPPFLLGRKSASVNLSDIAAMGGQPRACLLSVGFPGTVPVWFEDFMAGFMAVLQEHDTVLVGGDTVNSNNDCIITVTVIGEADRELVCYRSGAQPGDQIWVSGPLGNGAAGLALCRRDLRNSHEIQKQWQQLVKAHLDPEAKINLGRVLANSGLVQAMIDISDGLATDLAHLCSESMAGAEIQQNLLPVSEMLEQAAAELEAEAMDWVLQGGEDYQLLFTAKASDEEKLRELIADQTGGDIFAIGRIIEGRGVYLCSGGMRQEISYKGYDHFAG